MTITSIRCYTGLAAVGASGLLLAAIFVGCSQETPPPPKEVADVSMDFTPPAVTLSTETVAGMPTTAKTAAKEDAQTVKIGACDGGKPIEVPKDLKGQALADSLMAQWKLHHPEANWVAEEMERHAIKPPADNSHLLKGDQAKGHAYGNYSAQDLLTWTRETEKFVAEGSRIFHSGDDLGSAVAVSCDMCHPHASNTHPETYPKFQTQLGRVALLRDMINWCIENPVRGEKLAPDSPAMRALEAYIQSQRQGVPLNYGKH